MSCQLGQIGLLCLNQNRVVKVDRTMEDDANEQLADVTGLWWPAWTCRLGQGTRSASRVVDTFEAPTRHYIPAWHGICMLVRCSILVLLAGKAATEASLR